MILNSGIWTLEDTRFHESSIELAKWMQTNFNPLETVNDLGCGKGYYCQYLSKRGFKKIQAWEGTDGINSVSYFHPINKIDLSQKIDVPKGQTICLEVGEHIPKEFEQTFLDNLKAATDSKIIMSWAIPGQGGHGHVNCQPSSYIIDEMVKRGFAYDENKTNEVRSFKFDEPTLSGNYFKNTLLVFYLLT